MESKTIWSGRYKDIGYEIVKWGTYMDGLPHWNSYIYIHDEALVDRLWQIDKKTLQIGDKGMVYYSPHSILEDLPWNCGQTYYHQVVDNEGRYIKIGDDYQHYWDEGKRNGYDEKYIEYNIKEVIDALHSKLADAPKNNPVEGVTTVDNSNSSSPTKGEV